MRRHLATGPILIGLHNANIVANLLVDTTSRMVLPSTRTLAKMVLEERDFLDLYTFDRDPETT
jgi:hypothetical protein